MAESSHLNPERLKSFVRNVCIIMKRKKESEKARSDLQNQIGRLKVLSSSKKGIDEELKELDRKISLVLEAEMRLRGIKQKEKEKSDISGEMMRNVAENSRKINQINESLNSLREKLGELVELKPERKKRDKRAKETKRRIKKEERAKAKKKDSAALKNRLGDLEKLYARLKKKGVDVSRVKGRINGLKLRLGIKD